MKITHFSTLFLTLAVIFFTNAATHATVTVTEVLIPFDTIDGGYGSGAVYGIAIDGETGYFVLSLNNKVQIVRIDGINAAQTRTQLMDHATWLTASGGGSMVPFQGFDLTPDKQYLQWAHTPGNNIWRFDVTSTTLYEYVSADAIDAVTATNSNLLANNTVNPITGEHTFFDTRSEQLLTTAGSNNCVIIVTRDALTNLYGTTNARPFGGMGYGDDGTLYFGVQPNPGTEPYGGLYKRDPGGALSLVFDRHSITSLSENTTLSFGTMNMGPDGRFYFAQGAGTAKSLLSFDPADPQGTLSVFISTDELLSSVAGSANINSIRHYVTDPQVPVGWAWHQFGQNAVYVTQIPEPSFILGILFVFGLARRRHTRNCAVECGAFPFNTALSTSGIRAHTAQNHDDAVFAHTSDRIFTHNHKETSPMKHHYTSNSHTFQP